MTEILQTEMAEGNLDYTIRKSTLQKLKPTLTLLQRLLVGDLTYYFTRKKKKAIPFLHLKLSLSVSPISKFSPFFLKAKFSKLFQTFLLLAYYHILFWCSPSLSFLLWPNFRKNGLYLLSLLPNSLLSYIKLTAS